MQHVALICVAVGSFVLVGLLVLVVKRRGGAAAADAVSFSPLAVLSIETTSLNK